MITSVIINVALGQQHINFTQYMFNPLYLNPASAGAENALSVTATSRFQWTGIKGAPSIQMLTAHMPIDKTKAGVGLALHNDQIGYTNQSGAFGYFSYKINLTKDKWTKGRHIPKSILSVGLRAGYNFFTNDLTKANLSANPTNNPDQSFQTNYNDQLFNLGFGIVYKIDKFYLSLSVPSIITTTPNTQRPLEVRSFFLATGSSYEINSHFKVQPNFLIKMSEGSPLQYDLNVNLVFNDLVWTGFTYRTSESVDFLFQLQATKTLRFGYSFDLLTNGLMAESRGTHEVMIKLSLPAIKAPKNTCVYPNYF